MHIYIYIYVCVCVCVYIHIYRGRRLQKPGLVRQVLGPGRGLEARRTLVHIYIYIYIYICVDACVYIYIYIYIHIILALVLLCIIVIVIVICPLPYLTWPITCRTSTGLHDHNLHRLPPTRLPFRKQEPRSVLHAPCIPVSRLALGF